MGAATLTCRVRQATPDDDRSVAAFLATHGANVVARLGRVEDVGSAPKLIAEDAPFKGEYLEVVLPERIVQTQIFDVPGFDDRAAINTMTFEDLGNRTKVTARTRFPSVEDLGGALATGMLGGALTTYDRLAEEIARG